MGKTDWASVSLPNSLMIKLDESLKLDRVKELGATSRSQIITLLIRKFLDDELNIFEDKSKDEIGEMRKIKKDIEKMKEEVKMENRTGESLYKAISELTEGKSEEIKNLSIKISDDGKVLLHDPSLEDLVQISDDDEGLPYCSHHKANFCYHISFVSMNLVKKGMEALKEKYNEK